MALKDTDGHTQKCFEQHIFKDQAEEKPLKNVKLKIALKAEFTTRVLRPLGLMHQSKRLLWNTFGLRTWYNLALLVKLIFQIGTTERLKFIDWNRPLVEWERSFDPKSIMGYFKNSEAKQQRQKEFKQLNNPSGHCHLKLTLVSENLSVDQETLQSCCSYGCHQSRGWPRLGQHGLSRFLLKIDAEMPWCLSGIKLENSTSQKGKESESNKRSEQPIKEKTLSGFYQPSNGRTCLSLQAEYSVYKAKYFAWKNTAQIKKRLEVPSRKNDCWEFDTACGCGAGWSRV